MNNHSEFQLKGIERRLLKRQMLILTTLLVGFVSLMASVFAYKEYIAVTRQIEVLTLAVSESVEDEHSTPHFQHSNFLGPNGLNPEHERFQWLDLRGNVLADRGTLPLDPSLQLKPGLTVQNSPTHALINVMLCYDDERPKRPYGFTRVAMSLEPLREVLANLLVSTLAALLLAITVSAAISRILARQALKPLWLAYTKIAQFSADASHELRTPITAILCNAELLREAGDRLDSSTRQANIGNIESAARQMKVLVDSLLTLARVSEQGQIRTTRLSLKEVAEQSVVLAEAAAAEKDIDLHTDLADVAVDGDESLLVSALANLIDNAVRHSSSGSTVRVNSGIRGEKAVLEVQDNGVGIAEEDQERVFERFWRKDHGKSYTGGSGLGLAVVRAIVEAHHGHIELESTPGEGTLFKILLPQIHTPRA